MQTGSWNPCRSCIYALLVLEFQNRKNTPMHRTNGWKCRIVRFYWVVKISGTGIDEQLTEQSQDWIRNQTVVSIKIIVTTLTSSPNLIRAFEGLMKQSILETYIASGKQQVKTHSSPARWPKRKLRPGMRFHYVVVRTSSVKKSFYWNRRWKSCYIITTSTRNQMFLSWVNEFESARWMRRV